MITTKIEVPPHLCEYIRGKYCNLTSDPVRFPDNLNIYHVIFDLLQKRPSEAPVDRGNLEICLPERSIGKSPVTYNYLGLRSQVIISRKIELMMWAELHEYLDEQKHRYGIKYIDGVQFFMRRYGIDSHWRWCVKSRTAADRLHRKILSEICIFILQGDTDRSCNTWK